MADHALQIRDRLSKFLGPERFAAFVQAAPATRSRGRLLYWQEDLLQRFAFDFGCHLSLDDYLHLFADVKPLAKPSTMSEKDWEDLQQFHENSDQADDLAMREAQSLHVESTRLAAQTDATEDPALATSLRKQAFDLQRQAAERCTHTICRQCGTRRAEHHIDAARLALRCGDFPAAVKLVWDALRESVQVDLERQLHDLDEQAEELRNRMYGEPLQEIAFAGGAFAFSQDSRHIVHLCGDDVFRIRDLATQESSADIPIPMFATDPGKFARLYDVCCTPDGRSIAFAGGEGSIFLWDRRSQKVRLTLTAHAFTVIRVIASPDGQWLASCGAFGVKFWDAATGKKRASFEKQPKNIYTLAFAPDSRRLAWGDEFGRITLIDTATREVIFSFKPIMGDVFDIAFSPCSRFLAVSGSVVKVLDASDGREVVTLSVGGRSRGVAFSPDGELLAATGDSVCLLWRVQDWTCIRAIPDTRWMSAVRFSPDGKSLAVLGRRLRLWNVAHLLSMKDDIAALTGNAGTTTIPANPRPATLLPPSVSTPVPTKMPAPAHLRACTSAIPSRCRRNRFVANVKCYCGGTRFRLLHTGAIREQDGEKYPRVAQVGAGYFLIIKAACTACATDHLLFDDDYHGWNGFVVATGDRATRPGLVEWVCNACGESEHSATISLFSEGRQEAIQESAEFLNDTNWQEGFGSIVIDIKCTRCKHKVDDWLSHETM
jgi:hypothetical protein